MGRPDDGAEERRAKKLVVIVSTDQRNGGAQGAGDGAAEAAKALGWDFRIARRPGHRARPRDGADAGDRAEARRHHSRRHRRQGAAARCSSRRPPQGIKIVGWHAGPKAGPVEGIPQVFTNVTTDPLEVAKPRRPDAVVNSDGNAGVDPVHRLDLRDRHRQDQRRKGRDRRLHGLQGAVGRGHADRRPLQPHGPADDLAAFEIRQGVDLFDRRQRSLFRLLGAGADLGRHRSGDRLPAANFRRRRFGAGVPAHPREAVSDRDGRRTAESAGLAADRRTQPRLRRREADRLRAARCICSPPTTSTRTAARRTSSTPATATRRTTRRSGA